MTVFIMSVLFALTVSFICSLMEATLLSLTPSQVADINDKNPKLGAIWRKFKSNIEYPIAVILTLNTAAHTIGASIAGSRFDELFGDEWIWLFSVIFTLLMLQFTEIVPKTLGVRKNRQLAHLIARPLNAAILFLKPVIWLMHFLNRPFEKVTSQNGELPRTIEEISALAGLARLSREINRHQERIIKGASMLSHLPLEKVMIPAGKATFLSTGQSVSQAFGIALEDLHTRYPVCEDGDFNRVIGYVNFKELAYLMQRSAEPFELRRIIRPVHFAAPEEKASDLLRIFVDQRVHIAIVRDPKGLTLGLVTLEDVVEEFIGELEDEFDRLPRSFLQISDATWVAGGGVPVQDIRQNLEIAADDGNESLSAWIARRLGKTPRPGDIHREQNLSFTVRRVRRGRVLEAVIQKDAPLSA